MKIIFITCLFVHFLVVLFFTLLTVNTLLVWSACLAAFFQEHLCSFMATEPIKIKSLNNVSIKGKVNLHKNPLCPQSASAQQEG